MFIKRICGDYVIMVDRFLYTYFKINLKNNFAIDMAAKSKISKKNSISPLYKENMMFKFMEVKSNEPKLKQKQISKQLGFFDSTIKR